MCKSQKMIDLGFCDEQFPAGTHMCLIYTDEEERMEIMSKFLEAGLSSGEKVAYYFDDTSPEQVKEWLGDLENESQTGKADRFSVSKTADIYHPDGNFTPEAMLNTLKEFHEKAKAGGYSGSRATGEMTWALKGIPGSDRLIEYEAKINDIVAEYPFTAMCQFDATQFDGGLIFDCLKVHPYVIAHGQIVRNPFYIKSADYLK